MNDLNTWSMFKTLFLLFLASIIVSTSTLSPQHDNIFVQAINRNEQHVFSYTPHDKIYISEDQHFIDLGFDGAGTVEKPYRIEYLNITTDSMRAIYVRDTTVHFVIQHCLLTGGWYGIEIENIIGGNITISNNTISRYPEDELVSGIHIDNSANVTIHNNYCDSDTYGAYLVNCPNITISENTFRGDKNSAIYVESTPDSFVINNTCFDSNWGVYLVDSPFSLIQNNTCTDPDYELIRTELSENVIITENTLIDTTDSSSVYGIYIDQGHNSTITNNTIASNEYGIWLIETNFTFVGYNLVQDQRKYAIMVGGMYGEAFPASNNTIHHNTFVNNNGDSDQARDYGENNMWYEKETLEGNYWSDYVGTGSYVIGGSAGAVDPYPLNNPVTPPLISEFREYFPVFLLIVPIVTFIREGLRKKGKK